MVKYALMSEREAWIQRSGPLIRYAVEKGIIGTQIEQPAEFNEVYMQAIRDGLTPFIVARHESHPDGLIIARLTLDLSAKTSAIDPNFKGFFMPLAQSLEEGQQDMPLMRIYQEIKPTLKKFGLVPAPIVREKDKKEYEMQTDKDEQERMRKLLSEGFKGAMLFPEGTTTGGKTFHEEEEPNGEIVIVDNVDGQVNGMVPFELNSIKKTYLFIKRNLGTEVVFIPAATFGGRGIMNPDNKFISPLPFLQLLSPEPRIGKICVGTPIRSDSPEVSELLKSRNRDDINTFLALKIAALIPERQRGAYA